MIGRLEEFVNREEYYPARNSYRGIIVLALLSKALTVARAVCTLLDGGFPGEAFGLTRTLIDICFTVRYISNRDTETRAKRFAEFYAKDHEGWGKIIKKFYPTTSIASIEATESHHEALEIAKTYKSAHQWTGMGDQTRQMACEADSFEFDAAGNGITCEWDYEVIYKWTSFYVHSTVSAFKSHLAEPMKPFRIRSRDHIDEEDILVNVLGYISRIFVHAYRAMKQDSPEEILQDIETALAAFNA